MPLLVTVGLWSRTYKDHEEIYVEREGTGIIVTQLKTKVTLNVFRSMQN